MLLPILILKTFLRRSSLQKHLFFSFVKENHFVFSCFHVFCRCLRSIPILSHNTCVTRCTSEELALIIVFRWFNHCSCFQFFKKIYFLLCCAFVMQYFFLICPYLSSIYEKANCIAFFGGDALTPLGVVIFEEFGLPVFHIKMGASRLVPCPRTQQASLPACFPQHPLNAERQAGEL